MTTYEMVALADKNRKTYVNGKLRYNKEKGFHDERGNTSTLEYEYEVDQLNAFIHDFDWEELKPKKMTIEEIEKTLGYSIEIIGRSNEEDKN